MLLFLDVLFTGINCDYKMCISYIFLPLILPVVVWLYYTVHHTSEEPETFHCFQEDVLSCLLLVQKQHSKYYQILRQVSVTISTTAWSDIVKKKQAQNEKKYNPQVLYEHVMLTLTDVKFYWPGQYC